MKLLSLNVHSWMEIHPSEKLLRLAQAIIAENAEVVALQEVNQLSACALQPDCAGLATPLLDDAGENAAGAGADAACADVTGGGAADTGAGDAGAGAAGAGAAAQLPQPQIGFDNFARLLTRLLADLGHNYQWYWAPAHIGFERYDEGAAILVREDRRVYETQEIVLADYPYDDVRRRVVQAVRLEEGWVVSGHFSWWHRDGFDLFQPEWDTLQAFADAQRDQGHATIVAGDLNNPATACSEGYDYIRQLGWIDTYTETDACHGENTIVEPIAGWEGTTGPRRIDYVLSNQPVTVQSHQVIFDGQHYPVVSDHYGLLVNFQLD